MPPEIDPDDPWLFERQGLDWRWLSWREAAASIEILSAALAALAPGSRVAFDGRASVASVLADCAVRAAGLTAVPVVAQDPSALAEAARTRGAQAWLPLSSSVPEVEEGLSLLALPADLSFGAPRLHPPAGRPGRSALPDAAGLGALATGGAVVTGAAGHARLDTAELEGEARRVSQDLGVAPARDITVLAGSLELPLSRMALTWALAAGAVLVLEPDAQAGESVAAWARPTVLAATASELARWADMAAEGRGGKRSPLGRLRAWMVEQTGGLPEGTVDFWRERGTVLVRC